MLNCKETWHYRKLGHLKACSNKDIKKSNLFLGEEDPKADTPLHHDTLAAM